MKVKLLTFRPWPWLDFLHSEHMGHSTQVPPFPSKHAFYACWLFASSAIFLPLDPSPAMSGGGSPPLRLPPYGSSSYTSFCGFFSAPEFGRYPNHPPKNDYTFGLRMKGDRHAPIGDS